MSFGDFFNDYIYKPVTKGFEWLDDNVVGKMPTKETVGDTVSATGGTGLLGSLAETYTNNPWLGDATAGAAVAALQYSNQKDEQKAYRDLYKLKHEQDMELQNLKNDQENERYWVKPGNLDRGAYTKGWVGDPLKEDNNDDKYKWRFR